MIRGKDVNQALAILRFSKKRAADNIEKCVRSAIANANEAAEKANVSIDPDDLWVLAAYVDRGPTKNRRRVRPAPQGRAYREQRHFCHVTIKLSNDAKPQPKVKGSAVEPVEAKPAKLAASKGRKRGGAAAAPRAKKAAPKAEAGAKEASSKAAKKDTGEKAATKKASKKKTSKKDE